MDNTKIVYTNGKEVYLNRICSGIRTVERIGMGLDMVFEWRGKNGESGEVKIPSYNIKEIHLQGTEITKEAWAKPLLDKVDVENDSMEREFTITVDTTEAVENIKKLKKELKELVELYEKLLDLQDRLNANRYDPCPVYPNPYDQYPPYPGWQNPVTWDDSTARPNTDDEYITTTSPFYSNGGWKCLHVTISNEKKVDDDGKES